MAKKKETHMSQGKKVGIGVGLTAAAVAAAGAYFLYGSSNAPKNRKKVKSWMLKAKAEVLEALEKAEQITAEEYTALIDAVGSAYALAHDTSKNEIAEFKREMKEHWNRIERVHKGKKPAKKATKKSAPKSQKKPTKAKKSTKKSAKKS